MKTIGIFGDSHADCTYLEWKTKYTSIGLGWPELLALKHKVKSYAAGGSGMFYSYNIFKQVYSKFDVIIYVPTQSTRFTVYLPDENRTRHMVPGFLLSQAARELAHFKKKNAPNDYKAMEAAIGYAAYILDNEKENEMKRLMLAEIKRLRPDALIIPAFADDIITIDETCLGHISNIELNHYNTSLSELRKLSSPLLDIRKCHLTDENNRMVYHKVLSAIDNNEPVVRIYEADFVAPRDPITKYFVDENGRTNV